MSFDEFLSKIGSESDANKKWENEKPARLASWRKDCNDLYAHLENMLLPTLAKGILKITHGKNYVDDPDFGRYECHTMIFTAGDRVVSLTPKWYTGGGYDGMLVFNRPSRKPDRGIVRLYNRGEKTPWQLLEEVPKKGSPAHLQQTDHHLSELNVSNLHSTLQYILS